VGIEPTDRTRVLYILSSPHSGSTLLGIVLAHHPDVVYGGELVEIPDPAWTDQRNCSCGLPGGSCPFWKEVKERYAAPDGEGASTPASGTDLGWRALPRALLGPRFASAKFRRHARDVQRLAVAIGATARREVVIDTSKEAPRALAYLQARSPTFDVQFLHLIRDGRGVVYSRKSHHIRAAADRNWIRTAALRYSFLWVFANLQFTLLFSLRKDHYLRVRYEDFIADPTRVLERIGQFTHLDLSEVAASVAAGASFAPGHVVAGNRLRLSGGVQVKRGNGSNAPALLPEDRRVFRWVAGWYSRLNGYT
jgi:Sulfotransferase family